MAEAGGCVGGCVGGGWGLVVLVSEYVSIACVEIKTQLPIESVAAHVRRASSVRSAPTSVLLLHGPAAPSSSSSRARRRAPAGGRRRDSPCTAPGSSSMSKNSPAAVTKYANSNLNSVLSKSGAGGAGHGGPGMGARMGYHGMLVLKVGVQQRVRGPGSGAGAGAGAGAAWHGGAGARGPAHGARALPCCLLPPALLAPRPPARPSSRPCRSPRAPSCPCRCP